MSGLPDEVNYETVCKGHVCCCCNSLWFCNEYACAGGRRHCPGHDMATNESSWGSNHEGGC